MSRLSDDLDILHASSPLTCGKSVDVRGLVAGHTLSVGDEVGEELGEGREGVVAVWQGRVMGWKYVVI